MNGWLRHFWLAGYVAYMECQMLSITGVLHDWLIASDLNICYLLITSTMH